VYVAGKPSSLLGGQQDISRRRSIATSNVCFPITAVGYSLTASTGLLT
jgi:hypothetical protein